MKSTVNQKIRVLVTLAAFILLVALLLWLSSKVVKISKPTTLPVEAVTPNPLIL